jgi:hypothetical protein
VLGLVLDYYRGVRNCSFQVEQALSICAHLFLPLPLDHFFLALAFPAAAGAMLYDGGCWICRCRTRGLTNSRIWYEPEIMSKQTLCVPIT